MHTGEQNETANFGMLMNGSECKLRNLMNKTF